MENIKTSMKPLLIETQYEKEIEYLYAKKIIIDNIVSQLHEKVSDIKNKLSCYDILDIDYHKMYFINESSFKKIEDLSEIRANVVICIEFSKEYSHNQVNKMMDCIGRKVEVGNYPLFKFPYMSLDLKKMKYLNSSNKIEFELSFCKK